MVTSASDVLGPVLAGALMGFGSLTYVLGINLLTYIIAITILCLLWTRLYVNTSEESVRDEKQLSFLLEVKEGLTFLFEKKALFTLRFNVYCIKLCIRIKPGYWAALYFKSWNDGTVWSFKFNFWDRHGFRWINQCP